MGRVGWIMAGGAAILAGMAVQGTLDFNDNDHDARVSRHIEVDGVPEKVEVKVAGLVDRIVADHGDEFTYTDRQGERVNLDPQSRKDMAQAIGALLKAEARLVVIDIRERDNTPEGVAARKARDDAKQRVESLERQIEERSGASARDIREERDDLRRFVRDEVRDAVRN